MHFRNPEQIASAAVVVPYLLKAGYTVLVHRHIHLHFLAEEVPWDADIHHTRMEEVLKVLSIEFVGYQAEGIEASNTHHRY